MTHLGQARTSSPAAASLAWPRHPRAGRRSTDGWSAAPHYMRAYGDPSVWDIPLQAWPALNEYVRRSRPTKTLGPCQATVGCPRFEKSRLVCSAHYEAARQDSTLWDRPLETWPPLRA